MSKHPFDRGINKEECERRLNEYDNYNIHIFGYVTVLPSFQDERIYFIFKSYEEYDIFFRSLRHSIINDNDVIAANLCMRVAKNSYVVRDIYKFICDIYLIYNN